MKKVLTIAGSDCSGGAGVQADIKTMAAHKVYAMGVVTALTAQNTTGLYGVCETDAAFVERQLDCIFTDLAPDAVKIGMVSNADIVEVVSGQLKKYQATNIVVDPVMVSTRGSRLLNEDALEGLVNKLFPIATLVTPNIPEAEVLCGMKIHNLEDVRIAAQKLSKLVGGGVLLKGGHLKDGADDLLYWEGKEVWFWGSRIGDADVHGTGCALSSAIACNLAKGRGMGESVKEAKEYVANALKYAARLGKGDGLLSHFTLPPFA